MSSINRLSVNNLKRIVEKTTEPKKVVNWHKTNIVVRRFLPIDEYVNVIQSIVKDCTSQDGRFVPLLLDFSIKLNVIFSYALIDMPDDVDYLFYIVYASDLYDVVCDVASKKQIDAITNAVLMSIGGEDT